MLFVSQNYKLFCLLLFFCSNFICFLSFCLAQNSRITLTIIYIIYMYILYACLAALCELWVVLYNMLLLLNVIWNLSMRNVDQVHTHTLWHWLRISWLCNSHVSLYSKLNMYFSLYIILVHIEGYIQVERSRVRCTKLSTVQVQYQISKDTIQFKCFPVHCLIQVKGLRYHTVSLTLSSWIRLR